MLPRLFAILIVFYFFEPYLAVAERPQVTRLAPYGARVGSTQAIEAVGTFKSWPIEIWCSNPGVRWRCKEKAGEFEVTTDPTSQPGLSWFRFYNDEGATPAKPFLLSSHPPLSEVEPNDRLSEVKGFLGNDQEAYGTLEKNGDIDHFLIHLEQGQTVSATVDATRFFKSPLDPQLQLIDERGFVLVESIDHFGLDPGFEFTVKKTGDYFLRVFGFPVEPDSTISFRGGAEWCYRLRWDTKSLGNETQHLIDQPLTSRQDVAPATTREKAIELPLPASQYAVIVDGRETHYYKLPEVHGSLLQLRILAQSMGSALDPTLSIVDSQGKQVATQDDDKTNRDPLLEWQMPAMGDYWIAVADFHRQGGAKHAYWLLVKEMYRGVKLTNALDSREAKVGEEFELSFPIERIGGWTGKFEIGVRNLPAGSTLTNHQIEMTKDGPKTAVPKLKIPVSFQGPIQFEIKQFEPDRTSFIEGPTPAGLWLSIRP
jgi:hypothetical protein